MAEWLVSVVPESMGPHMGLVAGALSPPLAYLISNDGFHFGVPPILLGTS